MMTKRFYNYAIIRFLPYRDRGEFINTGIVMHGNDGTFSSQVVEAHYPHISNVFPLLPDGVFSQQLQILKNELARIEALANHSHIEKQKQLFRTLTEPSEGVFTFSQSGTLTAQSAPAAFEELFNRYVHHDFKHITTPEEQLTKNVTHWLRSLNR